MPDVTIENPVINSPFDEPRRYFRFTENRITDEIVEGRCISEYFVPIPRAKKRSPKQLSFETEWTSDRLRVLMPNDPQNYYRQHDLVPVEMQLGLGKTKMGITNFHTFTLREKVAAGKLTKDILRQQGEISPFTETPEQMVRRVCRELGNKKNIVMVNDEAHHCYRRKVEKDDEKLPGDERKEALQREEEARGWISGLEAKMAEVLEEMDEVGCYIKNYQLGFNIPYTFNGEEKQYVPDYLIRVDDGHGADNLLNLIVEVSGEARKDKAAKVAAARNLWIPAVNNHSGWGRWASSRSWIPGMQRIRSERS